jgi:TolB-like protein/DNA-binding winged helix-turn-helix (wHTH) protein/Tfp pilus assembly protein PilF
LPIGQRGCRTTFRFGAFELDPSSGELSKYGHRIHLQEQPFRILCLLLERPMELITRQEIRENLWGTDTFVDFDRSLNKAMVKLRQALSDNAESPRFIETLPGRGYRFLILVETRGAVGAGTVATTSDTTAPFGTSSNEQPNLLVSSRWRAVLPRILRGVFLAACVALVLWLVPQSNRNRLMRSRASAPSIQSLVVLPLENLSGDPNQDYFAEGMTDELTTDLARIHSLRVISRTTAMRYQSTHKSISEIARELNVDAVIEGSVVRSGDKVRITTQMIDARRDAHLWAQSYERQISNILEVQDSIALDIASQVRTNLSPAERGYFFGRAPLRPNAYDDYLRGRSELSRQNPDSIKKGVDYLQRAIDDDPSYARAYAGLAEAYSLLANYQVLSTADAFAPVKASAMKAIQLDPDSAEAHGALALVKHHYDWDWSGAEAEYKRAIELQPNFSTAHHRYAWFLSDVGRHDEALQEILRARELDPASIVVQTNLGRVLYHARRYDESVAELRKAVVLDPQRVFTHVFLGMAYEQKGLCAEAFKEFKIAGDDIGYAHTSATCGRPLDAKLALKTLAGPSTDPVQGWFFIAGIFAALGEKDHAFQWLNKAAQNHDFFITEMKGHPFMDPLRSDPRFSELLKRIGLPQ